MSASGTDQILVKDTVFQRGVSFMFIGTFILYNIMNRSIDYEQLIASFPQFEKNTTDLTKGTQIFWFYLLEVLKVHLWMFLMLVIIYVVLVIFQILVLFVLKFDVELFQKITEGVANALENFKQNDTGLITPSDIWKMMFSSLSYGFGIKLYLKLLASHILIALMFTLFIATPRKLKTKKGQLVHIRLFYLIMFVETIFFYIVFIILNVQG